MKTISFIIFLLFSNAYFSEAQIIDGYTDKLSYRADETITFFLSGNSGCPGFLRNTGICSWDNTCAGFVIPPSVFDVKGNFAVPFINLPGYCDMTTQSITTPEPYKDGFGYSATGTWTVPSSLKSGYYFLDNKIPFIVKGNKNTADITIVCPTNTDEAYNQAGGKNMYGTGGIGSPIVSFHRPIMGEGIANFLTYQGFLKWMHSQSYNINVISDTDMNDYSEIENAKLLIVIGHSEYWTRQARMNFDQFVDAGNDAMILSGNTMWWQVRHQADPDNTANPQIVCYRGGTDPHNHGYIDEQDLVTNCDPLLWTYEWDDEELKYSILGSIGSDWPLGGYSQNNSGVIYNGYGGYKIILENSPLLNGTTGLQHGETLPNNLNISSGETGELDGSPLMEGVDLTFDEPILDLPALGFYRAEIIGYDLPAYDPSSSPPYYAPIMAMQKTCTSGKIINVNSNYWCRESHFLSSDPKVKIITKNMIDLLLAGSNIFATPAPTQFRMTPSASTVSYSACQNGSIHITPCGVYITPGEGYKVDNNNYTFVAKVIDCSSCSRGARMATSPPNPSPNEPQKENTLNAKLQVVPNPNTGIFTLQIKSNSTVNSIQGNETIKTISIYDMIGKVVYQSENSRQVQVVDIDISNLKTGIYFIKVQSANNLYTEKVIVQ